MKFLVSGLIFCALLAPALAQSPPPKAPVAPTLSPSESVVQTHRFPPPQPVASDELLSNMSEDWQAVGIAQKHTLEDMRKLVQSYQALKAENEALKAENEKLKSPPPPGK